MDIKPSAIILVIDDDLRILQLTQRILRQENYQVETASQGEQGIKQARSIRPDIILLDAMLPDIDGFSICRQLRAATVTKEIVIIMITALCDQASKLRGLEAGVDDFIIKPFSHDELTARLRTLTRLNRYRKLHEERKNFVKLINLVPVGVVAENAQGNILFANQAFANLFGYRQPEELVTLKLQTLLGLQLCSAHETTTLTHRCQTKLGKTFWATIRTTPTEFNGQSGQLITLNDATNEVEQTHQLQQENAAIRQENKRLRTVVSHRSRLGALIGKSPKIQILYNLIEKAAESQAPILLIGESGCGKELVAKAIHELSARSESELITVNCGAIPNDLAESEFFGHTKGAFTGAHAHKKGFVEIADGSTLFLDEVGETSLNTQVKLLRVLENGEYTPVGASRSQHADFRLVAASNQDPQRLIQQGSLREDFYYRINVIRIVIPPLRERQSDISLLCQHFLSLYHPEGNPPRLSQGDLRQLQQYHWPGNVRELRSVIQRFLFAGKIDFLEQNTTVKPPDPPADSELAPAVQNFEKFFIQAALTQNQWRRNETANALGINTKTLYTKMKKFDLLANLSPE